MSDQVEPRETDVSDMALLAAWRGGDKRAGARLFDRYHNNVARFFMSKLDPEDSDDLVQRTFLGLLEGLERLQNEVVSVRALLFAIARNQLYYYLRNRVRDRKRFDPKQTSLAACDTTPTQAMAAREQSKLLLRALRELPLDTQLMFELRYWEGMQVKEVARALDMLESTVRVRMYRARKILEEHMRRLAESKEQLESTLSGLSKWAEQMHEGLAEHDARD